MISLGALPSVVSVLREPATDGSRGSLRRASLFGRAIVCDLSKAESGGGGGGGAAQVRRSSRSVATDSRHCSASKEALKLKLAEGRNLRCVGPERPAAE